MVIKEFQIVLFEYFEAINLQEEKYNYLKKLREHLSRRSNFTAFKRWIILENRELKAEFEKYFE